MAVGHLREFSVAWFKKNGLPPSWACGKVLYGANPSPRRQTWSRMRIYALGSPCVLIFCLLRNFQRNSVYLFYSVTFSLSLYFKQNGTTWVNFGLPTQRHDSTLPKCGRGLGWTKSNTQHELDGIGTCLSVCGQPGPKTRANPWGMAATSNLFYSVTLFFLLIPKAFINVPPPYLYIYIYTNSI